MARATFLESALARFRAAPTGALLWVATLGVGLYVIGYPFTVVTYPPITDLPFHAANASILAHHSDPAFGFRDQFVIQPLTAPYFAMYALGALFAWLMPIATAAKLMAAVMLALLPIGLGVLFHGMNKSPLWGALALGLVWNTLTHWGFLSFLGAIGLFAMTVGFALMVVDHPTRGRRLGLALSLLAVFFTHIYRFPFAVGAVLLTGVVMYPATRRYKPLIVPMLPALGLFVAWLTVRSHVFSPTLSTLTFDLARLKEAPLHVFGGFAGPVGATERAIGGAMVGVALGAWLAALVTTWADRPRDEDRRRDAADPRWRIGVTVLALLLALGFVVAYSSLPLFVNNWFFVYPREALTALFLLVAATPDFGRSRAVRNVAVVAGLVVAGRAAFLVATEWHAFERVTADFRAIKERVPRAPRLLYLVFDHTGASRSTTPFVHLPAWVQAELGGALYFHFVRMGLYPIHYDFEKGRVPPALPHMLEWQPQGFRVLEHGPWFDTFLVRHHIDPSVLFRDDRSIRFTARDGKWWLYRREGAPPSRD